MHLTYGPYFKFYLLPSFSFTLDTFPVYKGMPYLCLDCLIVLCFSSHHGYLCLGLGSNACDCTCVLTWIDHCLVNNSSMMVLHCGHTFLRTIDLYWTPLHALQYYTVGIPFWTWSQSSQFDGKLRDHVYVCVTERYTENIAYEENGWLSRGKFMTLLTFEVNSFRENGFQFYCIFCALATDTSHWMPKDAIRQNRENRHTHADTQDNYCNPRHACMPRVN